MTKFEKGTSGNPGGRPREVAEVRELARQHTPQAIAVLLDIMIDPASPPAARVSAANALLDRGYGRPSQEIKGSVAVTPQEISDEELARRLLFNLALVNHERAQKGLPLLADVIDVIPEPAVTP